MRVALIVPALKKKGPVIVARDIAQGLCERGIETHVFYLDESDELDFPCPTTKLTLKTLRCLRQYCVVHSHSLRPDIVAWLLRNVIRSNQRFITTIHNYVDIDLRLAYGPTLSILAAWIWKAVWGGLDARIALTKDAQKYYSTRGISTAVIYNGRPVAAVRPINNCDARLLSGLRRDYRVIGTAAAVIKRKGLAQVVYALSSLKDHAFVIVGDGTELAPLRQLATAMGLGARFVALGFRENVQDYLPYFDVYAMPSESEGMPLALIEAVQAGVPVVCSDIAVHKELFTPDEVTFFELNNITSLVQAMIKSGTAPWARVQRARARVSRAYSAESMTANYLRHYSALSGDCAHG